MLIEACSSVNATQENTADEVLNVTQCYSHSVQQPLIISYYLPAYRMVQLQRLAASAEAAPGREPRRRRGRPCKVEDVRWDVDAEAAVLAFWTAEGALLSEAKIQPHQVEQQQRVRKKILKWASRHTRHRSVAFLAEWMARAHAAAAEVAYGGDLTQVAFSDVNFIGRNRDPAGIISHAQTLEGVLAAHGINCSPAHIMIVSNRFARATMTTKLTELIATLAELPLCNDPLAIVERAPNLILLRNLKEVLPRRVAALQRLHPQLDVESVLARVPGLLSYEAEKLAANWRELHRATGLDDDGLRALVEGAPCILRCASGPLAWKLQQAHTYERQRQAAAARDFVPLKISVMARFSSASSIRIWRLEYQACVSAFGRAALSWVMMTPEEFETLHGPGFRAWRKDHPMPPEAFRELPH